MLRRITIATLLFLSLVFFAGCEYLSDPNLLRKSSDNTDEFQCTLTSPDEDGILKQRGYDYKLRCEAKQGPVRFVNLRASIVGTEYVDGRSRSRSLGEKTIRSSPVVVTPDQPFEYSGRLNVSAFGAWSGRRALHVSSVIDYPDDPERSYEEEEQDKINRPWRYKLLVVKKL